MLTLTEVAEQIRLREISPVELTRECVARVERLNPALNAFITVTVETALEQARRAEAEISAGKYRGPLHGIPVGLKDLFDTAGVRTTAASNQYRERVPAEDAEVVRRLKNGGAVLLGKLNRSGEESVECGAHYGRIVVRIGGGCGCGDVRGRARLRHIRIGPLSSRVVRRCGNAAEREADQPEGCRAAVHLV